MNIQIIRQLFALFICMLFLTSCNYDSLTEEDLPSAPVGDAISISGKETEVQLPVAIADIAHIEVSEDFAMPLTDSQYLRLYMEENADDAARTVELHLTLNDGSSQTLHYRQNTRTAADKRSIHDFSRTYGVGFSYNAVTGDYCNLYDIKSQVLNLKELRKLEEQTSESLLFIDNKSELSISVETSRSFIEYIQTTFFQGSVSADIILFKGKYRKELSVAEQGFRNSMYTKAILRKPVTKAWLDYPSLQALMEEKPDSPVLTRSFRNAIKRLEVNHSIEEVDAFLNKFGTHFINSAQLGGGIDLVYKINYDKFRTLKEEKELTEVDVLSFFNMKNDSEFSQEDLQILATANCKLSVMGGDASSLNVAVMNPSFANPNIDFEQYTAWVSSLCYDELNPIHNNVEMTDMEVTPIWDLIQNPIVANIVRVRIEGTAQEMVDLFGYFNFINTSFDILQSVVISRLGGKEVRFDLPTMTNIIARNRYLASVCYEWVPEIDTDEPVYVAYPIYEQQLELTSGLCIHKQKAYQVAWKYGQFEVKEIGPALGTTVYMNNGLLEVESAEGVNFIPASAVIGYEWPESILTNGTLNPKSQYQRVFKLFGNFFLDKPETYSLALPNWHFSAVAPQLEEQYASFIQSKGDVFFQKLGVKYKTGEGRNNLNQRMVRDDTYFYYWNKLELQIK